jgi:hypothetical protein
MQESSSQRQEPMNQIFDSECTVIQGKSIMYSEEFYERESFEEKT